MPDTFYACLGNYPADRMKMRIGKLLVGFGVGTALIAAQEPLIASAAAATEPVCAGSEAGLVSVAAPKKVAIGRSFDFSVSKRAERYPELEPGIEDEERFIEGVTLSTDKGQSHDSFKIHRSEESFTDPGFNSVGEKETITTSWSVRDTGWTEPSPHADYVPFSNTCQESTVNTVHSVRGEPAQISASLKKSEGSRELAVEARCPKPLRVASMSPVVVTVGNVQGERSLVIPDACRDGRFQSVDGPHFSLYLEGLAPRQRVSVGVFGLKNWSRFTFTAKQGGRLLGRGSFLARAIERPARRIYEGSDAYINYCIDELRTLHSLNGRLYCSTTGDYRALASSLHWSPN